MADGFTGGLLGDLPQEDRDRLAASTFGQIGALLLAAGQKQMPAQRAQYLAQLGNVGQNIESGIFRAQQARLMGAQTQEKMREMEQNKALSEWAKNPENLASVGMKPGDYSVLGNAGLRAVLQARTSRDPNQAALIQAQAAAAQAQTDAARAQLAERERVLEENKRLDELLKDPEQLKAIGLTPEKARVLGREGLKQYAVKQFGKSPLERLSEEELLRIAGVTPAPAAVVQQPVVAAPPISLDQVQAPAPQVTPPAVSAPAVPAPVPEQVQPQQRSSLMPPPQPPTMAEQIARNPLIQLSDPQRASAAATIAEKLRDPGTVAEAQTLARARAERQINQPTLELGLVNRREQTRTVSGLIDDAISRVSNTSAGLGGRALVGIPTTDAYALSKTIESIKANIGFDELNKMREASPTGGALGQVAVQEINYLQSVLGSLDQFQNPADLKKRLEQVKTILNRYQGIRENAYERDYGKKFDPTALTKELDQIRQQAGQQPAGQPAAAGGPPRITTKAEYDALPSKARFIGPDGKEREKP